MLVEAIESRTLLSASVINAQIVADRLEVRKALVQFNVDLYHNAVTMQADAHLKQTTTLKIDHAARRIGGPAGQVCSHVGVHPSRIR